VIVFDVLFDMPAKEPEDDALFAEAIASHGDVILATARAVKHTDSFSMEVWLIPSPSLKVPEDATGSMELPVDGDGVVRRARVHIAGRPSLSLAAVKAFAGKQHAQGIAIPENELVINFVGPRATIQTVSYYQALEPQKYLPKDMFKDKLVWIGATSTISSDPTRPDHFSTPFSTGGGRTPGVEIHANAAHNLLHGSYLTTQRLSIAWIGGLAIALLLGLLFFGARPMWGAATSLGISTTGLLLAYWLFVDAYYSVLIVHLLFPTATVFVASLFAHYYETFQSEKHNRMLLERSESRIRDILAGIGPGILLGVGADEAGHGPRLRIVRVFVSYHHKVEDADTMREILEFIKGLHDEQIEFWTDQKIRGGEFWDKEIRDKLAQTDIALALISQGYLDSDYVKRVELPSFLERGIKIIPVLLSPCEWQRHEWLKQRKILPGGSKTIAEQFKDTADRQRLYLKIKNTLRDSANEIRRTDGSGVGR
jgi:CHASE2 domain-containing sensor protein